MHTPTKGQWQTVIDNLKKVLPIATLPGHLNMMETEVNDYGTICGTVHCLGGWYAIAALNPGKERLSFTDGADKMAEDIGFDDKEELEKWAHENGDIWGNEYGYYMFSGGSAFDYPKTLADIVLFLEKVRDRSPE
jgi:hypothetical protein